MNTRHYSQLLTNLIRQHFWALVVLFGGVLLPFLLFGWLAEEVHHEGGLSSDVSILQWIHLHANPRRDYWVALVTHWGNFLTIPVLALVIIGLQFWIKNAANAAFFTVAVVGSWLLNLVTKAIFERARPSLWESVAPASYYSFPSGHSMVSMALAMTLVMIAWPTRWRWPAFVAAIPCVLLIGLSRMYLGVHYPSDVLGGWSAAIVWVTGVRLVFNRYIQNHPREQKL